MLAASKSATDKAFGISMVPVLIVLLYVVTALCVKWPQLGGNE
jgi:hypothetical protein